MESPQPVALFSGSTGFVEAVALAMVIVQSVDAIVRRTQRNTLKTGDPRRQRLSTLRC